MKEIKTHPEDVIDSLKAETKKDVKSQVQLKKAQPKDASAAAVEDARLENEAFKLDFDSQNPICMPHSATLPLPWLCQFYLLILQFSSFHDS